MNVYVTDGSENCFYTAVFSACTDRSCLLLSRSFQLPLGAQIVCVQEEKEKSDRVKRRLLQYDRHSLDDIGLILRSCSPEREMVALRYIRRIVQERAPVRDRRADASVSAAWDLRGKVTLEAHRMKGFLRFMEGANGIWYATFAPDNDILDLILPHFLRRLGGQPFVMHDLSRRKAAIWNGKDCVIVQTEEKVDVPLSPDEENFQNLWKQYYESVNIAQRPHEKQMKGYMPVRYWKFLPEKNGRPF